MPGQFWSAAAFSRVTPERALDRELKSHVGGVWSNALHQRPIADQCASFHSFHLLRTRHSSVRPPHPSFHPSVGQRGQQKLISEGKGRVYLSSPIGPTVWG
uniref:Uncharacterized protein n=1 Tax=Globodera rostochiensis TaxID=31243 RepID=A0A914H5A3_GLORO